MNGKLQKDLVSTSFENENNSKEFYEGNNNEKNKSKTNVMTLDGSKSRIGWGR